MKINLCLQLTEPHDSSLMRLSHLILSYQKEIFYALIEEICLHCTSFFWTCILCQSKKKRKKNLHPRFWLIIKVKFKILFCWNGFKAVWSLDLSFYSFCRKQSSCINNHWLWFDFSLFHYITLTRVIKFKFIFNFFAALKIYFFPWMVFSKESKV